MVDVAVVRVMSSGTTPNVVKVHVTKNFRGKFYDHV